MQRNLFKIFIRLILTNPDLLIHSILRRTHSYWYIYYKRKNYYKRLLESFISPVRRTRLLFGHYLHLCLFLPFHFLLLFCPCLFCVHLLGGSLFLRAGPVSEPER